MVKRKGFSCTYDSQKPSSKRTVAAFKCMQQSISDEKNLSFVRKKFRTNHKTEKISSVPVFLSSSEHSIARDMLVSKNVCFSNKPKLKIVDSTDGAVHWINKDEQTFSLFLLPRKEVINSIGKKSGALIRALNHLQETGKSVKRGKNKTGASSDGAKYAIFGQKVNRAGHGFFTDKLHDTYPESANILKKFATRMEHMCSQFLPSSLLRGIHQAHNLIKWDTISKKASFIASLASTKNHCAPAHIDNDFFLSVFQVNVHKNRDEKLDINDSIVHYFCFPEFGLAVALRDGDVLFFNPTTCHCLSEKTEIFKNVDVHVSTFYLKTAHVGLNNNSIPLSQEQNMYYSMSF